ncbi:MAG: ParD-like family protein [Gammaproteobacteria bacterium]|nr:ParD-like family protein [Gammaproteobacteria bacterium]
MGISINLDKNLVNAARSYSAVQDRSIPKQIEHWAKIGRIVEENPDLTYNFVMEILFGLEDVKSGNVKEYKKGLL